MSTTSWLRTDLRAELAVQARRPVHALLVGVAVTLTLVFGYVVPYAGYAAGTTGPPGSDRGLAAMLPDAFLGSATAGTPVFAGALALVLGALVVGSEEGWQTWKTLLLQGTGRLRVYAAKVAVAVLGAGALTTALLAAAAVASATVAAVEDAAATWPSAGEVVTGLASAWLITGTWAVVGAVLAVLLRSVALPVGLGLVWVLAVQNLLTALAAPLLEEVAEAQRWLPGPNAGSLVHWLGAPASTPGVQDLVGPGHAVGVLGCYLVTLALLGGWVFWRRDVR